MMKICSMCKKETGNFLEVGEKKVVKCFGCAGVKVGMVDNTKPRKEVCIPCEIQKKEDD